MSARLTRLTVEHAATPVGVDVAPRFGWQIETEAEGVTAVRARVTVADASGEVWRSRELSPEGVEVEYAGPVLAPLTRYGWTVEVDTTAGPVSARSWFVTGVTDGDWRGAHWIGHDAGGPAPIVRTEFDLPRVPERALLVVAAGGLARVRVNDVDAGLGELAPGFTDYDVTVQYRVVDVTALLRRGRNALSAELGRGFYGMAAANTWNWETAPWHAEPCVRMLLVADGEPVAATGETWRAIDGPTRYDDLYGGESFDAAFDRPGHALPGYDDSGWASAGAVEGPRGRLVNQRQQPIGIVERFAPDEVVELEPGRWVVSFPRVIAGWVELVASSPGRIELRSGERLGEDGRPNADDDRGYYDGRFQLDEVTPSPSASPERPFRWRPRFGYKGFQHVEVTAATRPQLTAVLVHTLAERTGGFACSDASLTRLHELTVSTVLNNLHGLPTDTPKYEKNGWTGDGMVGAELMLANLDVHELLAKWVADIAASRHGEGAPEVIAPHGGWTMDWSPAPTWHAALVLIPQVLHRWTGDVRVLRDTWPDIRDYLRFEVDRSPGHLADTTLGDWVAPETDAGGGNPDEDSRVPATVFLIAMLDAAAEIASLLGEPADEWRMHAAAAREAFLAEFVAPGGALVRGEGDAHYRQSHTVLALAFDVLPGELRQAAADLLDADVRARGDHLDTGALATKFLLPVLTRFGHVDTAWRVATQRTFPSWGFWLEHGATSLWEHWKLESRSRGHYFLGTLDDWLFQSVAGLAPIEPGWRRARIAPAVTHLADWAAGHVQTPFGRLSVHWRRTDAGVELELTVPVGMSAEVELPGHTSTAGPGRHRITVPAARRSPRYQAV
jgi:alpha-L-rhamnosidase